jgi:hypothetical protein
MMHLLLPGPVVLFGVIAVVQAQALLPFRITGARYDGVIIRVNEQEPSGRGVSPESCCQWTPTEAQVREAEALLPAFLGSGEAAATVRGTRLKSELQAYKRQYWGQKIGKRREIRILFYHQESQVVKRGRWLKTAVGVAGGGDDYFSVTYQLERKRFSKLRVNAPL